VRLATCERLALATGERQVFYNLLQRENLLPQPRCDQDHPDPQTKAPAPVGERVALAYDAAVIVVAAFDSLASQLRTPDPTRTWRPAAVISLAVRAEALRLNASGFVGVTGAIEFAPDTGDPIDKRISIIKVDSIRITGTTEPIREAFYCGSDEIGSDPACQPRS
jgi:hypothetical protein